MSELSLSEALMIVSAVFIASAVGIEIGMRWAADEVIGVNKMPEKWAACLAKAHARKAYRDELTRQKGKP